jgi:hypothetical protein
MVNSDYIFPLLDNVKHAFKNSFSLEYRPVKYMYICLIELLKGPFFKE